MPPPSSTLTSLITSLPSHTRSSSSSSPPSAAPRKVYPNDDTLLTHLQARARLELPYTRVGSGGTEYVVVNPLRSLGCMGEESRKGYKNDVDVRRDGGDDEQGEERARAEGREANVYELAGRVWLLMLRRGESQSVVYHGITGSGKSITLRHLTTQLLALSSPTKAHRRTSDQITSLLTLLEAFGHSKTPLNPSASQQAKYLELHFTTDGRIAGAKVLPFGLNKRRIGKLRHEERSFHVFYQLLAGASPEEMDALNLEDPSSYALLASSGCYRLPGGPFSDDSTQLQELRVAMASLGFKAKHVRSIFTILTAILLLSNLTFADDRQTGSLGMTSLDERARVVDRPVLVECAAHLGVPPDDLEAALVNRTKWVKRDLCSVLLDADGAATQRDALMRDLYAILFTFVVEMANKRLAPSAANPPPLLQIVQLDLPGYTSRTMTTEPASRPASMLSTGPLVLANGQNGFDEFAVNYMNELVHAYYLHRCFGENQEMNADGIRVEGVVIMDNSACVELLRGGLLGSNHRLSKRPGGMLGLLGQASEDLKAEEREDQRSEKLLEGFTSAFGRHASFVAHPGVGLGPLPQEQHMFGINHYSGQCAYDVTDFIEGNGDAMDKQLVDLLRSSADSFVAKLFSGPGVGQEGHPLDEDVVVEAQVSVVPLRTPTPVIRPKIGLPAPELDEDGKEKEWPIDMSVPQPVTAQLNAVLSTCLETVERTRQWTILCIRPNDSGHPNSFDKRRVKSQIRSLLLPDLVKLRQVEYIADYPLAEFCARLPGLREEELDNFAIQPGWVKGRDYEVGKERIWLGWGAWRQQEDEVRGREARRESNGEETLAEDESESDEDRKGRGRRGSKYGMLERNGESSEDLLRTRSRGYPQPDGAATFYGAGRGGGYTNGGLQSPDLNPSAVWSEFAKPESISPSYEDRKVPLDQEDLDNSSSAALKVHPQKHHHATEIIATTRARRWWLRITWSLTWWVPSFCLRRVGKMDRADIRMAWREKLAIFMMIIGMCGIVVFYIIGFGRLLCPDSDKAWNVTELGEHAGEDDHYAAIAGKVYDFTSFYKGQHSDISAYPTTSEIMLEFAGQDLTDYFPPPMDWACAALVTSDQLQLMRANFTPIVAYAVHTSGPLQTTTGTKLNDAGWYENTLMKGLVDRYKGSYVWTKGAVESMAESDGKQWAIYKNKVYDLSDYLYTEQYYSSSSGTDLPNYGFLNDDISSLFQTLSGQDITKDMNKVFAGMSSDDVNNHLQCLDRAFYVGQLDFRLTPRCTVQNYLLLAFSVLIMSTIAAKFLAALQLGSKRYPELLDKFVICQVPCYTEGEESLARTINSLAALKYDDKRKLIFIICDGNIIGSGNNRPTPRIVLDILGVDPKLDPEPLLFKSIGEGSKQLNYAKVYSGLYEYEGHVVPYVVVVKVGKPTETSKPGNRGKRDSQVLLLQYLNRVHFDAPMSPLELEIYHQMRNVIGIDPTFYEYIFQVDADTTVTPDSLNRLIACASDDQRIIGICGETKVENERESLTTMIQVYEYYISHHLTKAFESLFGSVTCLPGCFSVYRIRTADKGRPVIISSLVIDEYAEPNVDTLHKKNLFSLGEDRYLTTLMMKHFPTFKMKFTPDAIAHTVAPSRWNVLLSQRRRWINSTIHNLVELLWLPEMCGFCFFSMRFIVFVDLLGTIILPATCVYLIYLIIIVSIGKAPIPVISLAMIAAVYGLQALIFILKREFMLVGWMVVYILAFPVYSLFLPLYSFWSMDDFSWGNTRKVVGEGNNKTVVYDDDEPFHESMIPYKSFKEYEANAWETTSLHSEQSRAPSNAPSSRTSRPHANGNRAASMYSSTTDLPPGADFWRDSSPLGPAHASRTNLRHMSSSPSLRPSQSYPYLPNIGAGGQLHQSRVQSMAGMSMWGPGSEYGGGGGGNPSFMHFPPPGMAGPMNPFDSPAGSDTASLRPPTFYPPYGHMMAGMGAPRNSVMTNLGGSMYGGGAAPQTQAQTRMSSYSLAPSGQHPLSGGSTRGVTTPLVPDERERPGDEVMLDTLRRYLQQQDLMSVTKRQTREAMYDLFPKANLPARAGWINENIDKILSAP